MLITGWSILEALQESFLYFSFIGEEHDPRLFWNVSDWHVSDWNVSECVVTGTPRFASIVHCWPELKCWYRLIQNFSSIGNLKTLKKMFMQRSQWRAKAFPSLSSFYSILFQKLCEQFIFLITMNELPGSMGEEKQGFSTYSAQRTPWFGKS